MAADCGFCGEPVKHTKDCPTLNQKLDKGSYYIGSDQYAFEVVGTLSPKRKLVNVDGLGFHEISLRKDGKWREAGSTVGYYSFGAAVTDLDPGF